VRAQGWDLVPVVIQDPVWEQSFPLIQGLLVPIADAATGEVGSIRLTGREARARQVANAERLEQIMLRFRSLQFDTVALDTSDPAAIDGAFIRWAARRRVAGRRS
jgi:hypothetical protein